MIVIQNVNGKTTVRTTFRGKEILIPPKHSYIIESSDPREDEILAKYIMTTYPFVVDITQRMIDEGGVRRK